SFRGRTADAPGAHSRHASRCRSPSFLYRPGQEGLAGRTHFHSHARRRPVLHRQGRAGIGGACIPRGVAAAMTAGILITGGIILCLIILSFLFSGTETGMTAVSRARLHTLERAGDARAALVARLISRKDRLVGALLIGNNLVNILASALATSLFLTLFGQAGVVYATI